MPRDLASAPNFDAYCKALFDALVLAEVGTSFGPGLSSMSAANQKAHVLTYATVLWQERGHTAIEDLLPGVRRWMGRHSSYPRVAELANVLDAVRADRHFREIDEMQRRNAELRELPSSSVVISAEDRKCALDRLGIEPSDIKRRRREIEEEVSERQGRPEQNPPVTFAEANGREEFRAIEKQVAMKRAGEVAKEDLARKEVDGGDA